jgi:hypothetical protein
MAQLLLRISAAQLGLAAVAAVSATEVRNTPIIKLANFSLLNR